MSRRERIGRLLPAPLAGVALLLVALILLTPVLLSSGQPAAGSLLTEADLILDRTPGSNVTHIYVRGVGETTRYSAMEVEIAGNFSWTGGFPSGPLNWTVAENASGVLLVSLASSLDPLALNVSVLYEAGGGSALYLGEIALEVGPGAGGPTVFLASATPGLSVAASVPVSTLPLIVPLVATGVSP